MGPLLKLALLCSVAVVPAVCAAQAPVERAYPPPGAAQAPPPPPGATGPGYAPPPPGSYGPPAGASIGTPAGEPPGAADALAGLTSQPAAHSSFSFDRDMLQSMLGTQAAGLNAVTVTNYRFHEPAFYVPEALAALRASYRAAGWKHLVEANARPREQASPVKPMTDLWLHYRGTEIDDVTILIRAPKQMNVIEVSGLLRPLDLIHLGGHFGIPKVDPGAVMVPER